MFSDECTFHLNGTINKHNLHYWSIGNPHIQHPTKTAISKSVTVWALVTYRGGVARWSIQDETMNGERYINNILIPHVVPYFNSVHGRNSYYQQDGAPAHYHNEVRAMLDDQLKDRWIGRRGVIEWPPRSPDLSVCDFFLWGYLREQVYESGKIFKTVDELKRKITQEINRISLDYVTSSFKNWVSRLDKCIENEGGHFE